VTGRYQPCQLIDGKRVPVDSPGEGYYPEIISKADYLAVQQGLSDRNGGGGRKGRTYSNIFSHLAKCGACGSPFLYVNKGKIARLVSCVAAHI